MKNVIVVLSKNFDEQSKVLNFLITEGIDWSYAPNDKEYIEKYFNVKCIERGQMRDMAMSMDGQEVTPKQQVRSIETKGDMMVQPKREKIKARRRNALTDITKQLEHSTMNTDKVEARDQEDSADTEDELLSFLSMLQNMLNNGDQTAIEVVEDVIVEQEEGEDTDSNADRPSTSTGRPKVDSDDKMPILAMEENRPEHRNPPKLLDIIRHRNICKVEGCGQDRKYIQDKIEHIFYHKNEALYNCLVENCGQEGRSRAYMRRHMSNMHPDQLNNYKEVQLSQAQVNEMLKRYFPSAIQYDITCQDCKEPAGKQNNCSIKLDHVAVRHIHFMLYKCMIEGCDHRTKTETRMKSHKHKDGSRKFEEIELTDEEQRKLYDEAVKCFPEFKYY